MRTALWVFATLLISAAPQTAGAQDIRTPAPKASPLKAPFDRAKAQAGQVEWAAHLRLLSPVRTNSIEMVMMLIPPGTFTMGSPLTEKDRFEDEDQVSVTLSQPFYLGQTEVTQREWQAVMGTTPWKGKPFVLEGDDYPATYVSWDQARAFCRTLSAKEDALYRLPTEAEWEYACRAGTTTRFSFGDDSKELNLFAWWGLNLENGYPKELQHAREVQLKGPNAFGLHDVHGNTLEWCQDVYIPSLPGGTDPQVNAGSKSRVYRGGAWNRLVPACRSADRNKFAPSYESNYLGFRVARNSDP